MCVVLKLVIVGIVLDLTAGQNSSKDSEGDVCYNLDGTACSLEKVKNCPSYLEKVSYGEVNRPECEGWTEDTLICCEPQSRSSPEVGNKARQMCKKYAEAGKIRKHKFFTYGINCFTERRKRYLRGRLNLGLRHGRGGKNAEPKEYPHMALIGYGEGSSVQWLCGGSLISDRYILSAAHCTFSANGPARWVRLGEYNFKSSDDENNGTSNLVTFEIIERINHPNYTSEFVYNDIALYKLNSTVTFNEFIIPACLRDEYNTPTSRQYTATGWGLLDWGGKQSDILQTLNVDISSKQECEDAYNHTVGNKLRYGIKDESMICAGDVKKGVDTCPGDSGGPLQTYHPDCYYMFQQIGITSFGSNCGGNRPGVYTRVSHYIPWIESIVWPDIAPSKVVHAFQLARKFNCL